MKEKNLKYFLSPWIKNLPKININNLVLDSRKLTSKDVFIAIKGKKKDGHDFIFDALSKKITAVLSETTKKKQHGKINYINNIPIISFFKISEKLSILAGRFYCEPSSRLKVIGITGTNGKTTVSQLINQWSELLGNKTATMGTLGNGFYNFLKPTINTTSSAIDIQSFLHSVSNKVKLVTIEVSSHGLVQNRVKNVLFYIAIFTNLTQDHLDYHGSIKEYALAKLSLFTNHQVKKIILNANDRYAKNWLKNFSNKYTVAVTIKDPQQKKYATKWINATNIKIYSSKTNIKFESSWGNGTLSTCLIGNFNVENLLLALACMLEMNYKLPDLIKTSIQLKPIYGRMQKLVFSKKPIFIIDYAHTPDALKKALKTIKLQYSQKRIWCIFGCGGERDKKKRPLMGKIAEKIADKVIITNDNPRNENQNIIINEIITGCRKKEKITIIPDRKKAIAYVFFQSSINDIIFISGKGHENYQIVGDKCIYHSDQETVLNLLEEQHDSYVVKKIASITNGELYGKNITIHHISINSKKIVPNTLFIALKGDKFDGNVFIEEAIKKGCCAVITNQKIISFISYIIVENTTIALGQIANSLRNAIQPKILAITGSCGKTSVKEMTASILQKKNNIIYTMNNENNHIGVPITLLKLKEIDKYGLIELGANNPGDIRYISNISEPNVALINNIYHSHLAGFKSLLGISKEKSEIFSYLKKNSIVIINLDSHHLSQWKKKIKNKKIFYFSIEKKKQAIFLLLILRFIHIKHVLSCIHQLEK